MVKKKKVLSKQMSFIPAPGQPVQMVAYPDLYRHCMQLYSQQKYTQGRYVCAQLIKQAPRELEPQILMAQLHFQINDHAALAKLSKTLLRQHPKSIEAKSIVANYYSLINQPERAAELLKAVVARQPRSSPLLTSLAIQYMDMGNKEESQKYFDAAIRMDPNNVNAIWSRSMLLQGKISEDDLNKVEGLIDAGKHNALDMAQLHFVAAQAYRGSDITKEIVHLNKGNQLAASVRQHSPEQDAESFARFQKFISASLLRDIRKARACDSAPIFIAAMPRSGTTLLEQILGSHSEIFAIGESDAIHVAQQAAFQSGDLKVPFWPQADLKDLEVYLASTQAGFESHPLVEAAQGKRVVDKSISNVPYAGLIASVFPGAKIIYLKRHPLDVVLSCYQHYFPNSHNYVFKLEHAARQYMIFDKWMSYLSKEAPENVFVASYEDLTRDPESQVREILAFCDLQWEDGLLDLESSQHSTRSDVMMNTREGIYVRANDRWKAYSSLLKPAADILGIDMSDALPA